MVTATSTHVFANGSSFGDCTDCHNGHANGTTGVNDVEISTVYTGTTAVPTMTKADGTTALYSAHGYKIQLGGSATTAYAKSTEAEICWACHDARAVSEWGTNSNTDTGSIAYDYGDLYTTITGTTKTSNWVAANTFWRSGKGRLSTDPFYYKRGAVRSTHSANFDGTTAANDTGKPWKGTVTNTASAYSTTYNKGENLDTVANIRCSYCHDVHGTHNGIKGDNSSTTALGGPYLRGTWLGNPYNEDGAPRYAITNSFTLQGNATASINLGRVPRASADPANNSGIGGWWIDQNSNNPVAAHATTAFRTATGNAGLCDQCHGTTKDGTWTAAEIGAIDQITGENLWVSSFNGHANSVVGGSMSETGTNLQWNNTTKVGRNIFNRTVRGSATYTNASSNHTDTDMGLATHTSGRGYSYRSAYATTTGYSWFPRENATTETGTAAATEVTAYRYFAWNNVDYNSAIVRNFVIAAGTQKLEVTSLPAASPETAHNAQVNYHTFSCSKCHNPHASRLPKLMITNCLDTNHNTWEDKNTFTGRAFTAGSVWENMRHSQWAAAQNCHRLDSRATNNGTVTLGSGWTKVTPWIEDTAPNPVSGSGKTAELSTLPAY
ncbi:MAG: hypothetical protein A2091_10745 [Desulfuromonadales bacterium GWD2_61_12]|nr:MAG: hypothetical protein A2091_10745 [Desulfuromonadales bacterium GWD2_61_12]